MTDIRVESHGSILLLQPVSDAGREWCDKHISPDRLEFDGAIVVEHSYIGSIVERARSDGLEVRGA